MSKYRAYEETLDSGMIRIGLEGPGCSCAIAPQAGFNLFSWIVDGREIMMPTQDVGALTVKYGTPILFPLPNRTRNATYTFGGKEYTLTKHGAPVPIHGLAYNEPFAYRYWTDEAGAYCEGTLTFEDGSELCKGYPFPCRLTIKYSFCEKGLLFDATVENLGEGDMPFGLAIHPYFSKMGDDTQVFLQIPADRYFENEMPALLPTGNLISVEDNPAADLRTMRSLHDTDVDNVFHGMDSGKKSRVEWRAWGHSLTVDADNDFVNLVVYTPHTRPGFCIEPQTCSTDAANLYARGHQELSGLRILTPGQRWNGQIRLSID